MAVSKMPVSALQEMCAKFNFGSPTYELKNESGEPHNKTFEIVVTLEKLQLSAIGIAKVKQQAKHRAAENLIEKITALQNLPAGKPEDPSIDGCISFLQGVNLNGQGENSQLEENSTAVLHGWCFEHELENPEYHLVDSSGPSHEPHFVISCSLLNHKTTGEGRSKKVARRIAAQKMFEIVKAERSSQINADPSDV